MARAAQPKTRTRKPQARAKPLVLKNRCLEDFLPLTSAEEQLRQCAADGSDCIVKNFDGKRPENATQVNKLRSGFLRYLVMGGCEKSPISGRGIRLFGAYVLADTTDDRLDLGGCTISHDLEFEHCRFEQGVFLKSAECRALSLEGSSVLFVNLERAKAAGNVSLSNGFEAVREVRMSGAQINGRFSCQGASFPDPNNAIIANRARIEGDVDLGNVTAKGTIAFTGSEIGGDFTPQGAVLEGRPALQLRNTTIRGTLHWRGLGFVDGEVDLSGATCKTLNTGASSWLRKRKKNRDESGDGPDETAAEKKSDEYHTKLDNFSYEGFSNLPDNCKSAYWIEWLRQQPDEHLGKKFKPGPWEQLANVLDSMGYEEEARDIRIEKQKLQTRFMTLHEPAAQDNWNFWHWGTILFRRVFWGPLVGYGYKPGNALVFLFGLVLLATGLYHQAAQRGVMTPTQALIFKEARAGGSIPAWCAENWVYFPDENCASAMPSEYSEFQSFIYAADVALPVINLRMEDDWAPRVVYTDGSRDWFGWWVRTFEWFLIAAGWILSLLFVSAIGSSIRR